jgi:hypothetical protein
MNVRKFLASRMGLLIIAQLTAIVLLGIAVVAVNNISIGNNGNVNSGGDIMENEDPGLTVTTCPTAATAYTTTPAPLTWSVNAGTQTSRVICLLNNGTGNTAPTIGLSVALPPGVTLSVAPVGSAQFTVTTSPQSLPVVTPVSTIALTLTLAASASATPGPLSFNLIIVG